MKDLKELFRVRLNSNKDSSNLLAKLRCMCIINPIINDDNISSYKIGKTNQELSERFNSEYKDKYDKIIGIYESKDTDLIDWLEKELIELYRYKPKCDNKQLGGGPNGATQIYIVIKYK